MVRTGKNGEGHGVVGDDDLFGKGGTIGFNYKGGNSGTEETWVPEYNAKGDFVGYRLTQTNKVFVPDIPDPEQQGGPLMLKDATLSEIMDAFKYAYDLTQRDADYTMSQAFDVTGVSVNQSSHRAEHVKMFKNGVKLVYTLNVQEKGTAKGYDGRIISIVQPYYQYATSYDAGKGWDKDPAKMPTTATLGLATMRGYPYAITIYGTYGNNERMTSLYFSNLKEFQSFMTFVRGK